MNQNSITDILKHLDSFKDFKEGDEIDTLSLPQLKTFLYFQKTPDYIFTNINLLNTYQSLSDQDSMVLVDILVFNRIVEYLGKSEVQIITIFAMLKNKSEPNFDMLPKIYGPKIRYSKILDLLFNDDSNVVLGLFRLIEYLKQRGFTMEQFLIKLIKSRCIIWTLENERKSANWYVSYFETDSNVSDTIKTIENLFGE